MVLLLGSVLKSRARPGTGHLILRKRYQARLAATAYDAVVVQPEWIMKAVEKAVWYIENHYREAVSLDKIAAAAGVSRYHLSRMFCYAVGQPVSRYLRLRRLSRAAVALAAGAPDILDLALSVGYGSHEAFSRAFKEHFRMTPEAVRARGHAENLPLTEALTMTSTASVELAEPRFETLGSLTIAGISRHYGFDVVGGIPEQWQTFAPLIPGLSDVLEPVTYGVIYNSAEDSFDYLAGVALTSDDAASAQIVRLDIAPQTYAVFDHSGHVAQLRDTCSAIWSDWLPASGREAVEAPWFERYGERFDPQTGNGGLEVWIPVR